MYLKVGVNPTLDPCGNVPPLERIMLTVPTVSAASLVCGTPEKSLGEASSTKTVRMK